MSDARLTGGYWWKRLTEFSHFSIRKHWTDRNEEGSHRGGVWVELHANK